MFAVVGEFNKTLQLTPGVQVEKSPGLKPGTKVFCERVHVDGLPRFRNLMKIAHSVKLKVSQGNSTLRSPNVEVCFHRFSYNYLVEFSDKFFKRTNLEGFYLLKACKI